MDEEEALRNYCKAMVCRVQQKQLPLKTSVENRRRRKHGGASSRRDGTKTETRAGAGFRDHMDGNLPLCDQTGHSTCQSPQVQQPVPLQLITMLRIKSLKEQLTRAAEVELHDPALCRACEQEQASLALKTFIRRKKTQLQYQILTTRLNTQLKLDTSRGSWCKVSQSHPMPLGGFGRNYLVQICGSQQPGVALATTKERGVALATDEMRGYPDKNATGTHLARPHCPFSDR